MSFCRCCVGGDLGMLAWPCELWPFYPLSVALTILTTPGNERTGIKDAHVFLAMCHT